SGGIMQVTSMPLSGSGTPRLRPLFTTTNKVWYMDSSPDGSVYLCLTDRPVELRSHSVRGDQQERIASFLAMAPVDLLTVLPDGRTVVVLPGPGHSRMMAVEKGKDPVPLIATAEETAAPMSVVGPHEIAFMIGPSPHLTIAVANTATGRISQRLSPG